jgi:hypothetical protein
MEGELALRPVIAMQPVEIIVGQLHVVVLVEHLLDPLPDAGDDR